MYSRTAMPVRSRPSRTAWRWRRCTSAPTRASVFTSTPTITASSLFWLITLGVAILAKHFNIPFIVAAPTSTIDPATPDGSRIPIEQRDAREVSHGFGSVQTAPSDVEIYNPAFDVTPASLITAIVTERGVLRPPYNRAISEVTRVVPDHGSPP